MYLISMASYDREAGLHLFDPQPATCWNTGLEQAVQTLLESPDVAFLPDDERQRLHRLLHEQIRMQTPGEPASLGFDDEEAGPGTAWHIHLTLLPTFPATPS